jgi:hypothetical protein
MRYMDTMKAYVGNANRMPDSLTPRRLASVMNATKPRDIGTRRPARPGAADVMANTPAATETETVRT